MAWRDPCATVKHGHLAYTQFCALRTGRRFVTYSRQDRDLLLVVDTMPEVEDMRLRPAVVTYFSHGVEQRAEPVLWVRSRGVPEFWCARQKIPVSSDAHETLRSQLLPLRIGLREIDVASLLCPGRRELAAMIRRHARNGASASQLEQTRRELIRTPGVRWDEVLLGHHPLLSAKVVCRLIFDGLARFVPDDRLRADTRVALCETRPDRTEAP